jgi:hypothetical protein
MRYTTTEYQLSRVTGTGALARLGWRAGTAPTARPEPNGILLMCVRMKKLGSVRETMKQLVHIAAVPVWSKNLLRSRDPLRYKLAHGRFGVVDTNYGTQGG